MEIRNISILQTVSVIINPHHCPLKNIFSVKYLENGDRYDDGVNGSRIENHLWAIDWHHDLWAWMTLNPPNVIKIIRQIFRKQWQIRRYGQWKSNRKPSMGYRLAPWPLTLDCPRSRWHSFGIKYLEYGARYNVGHNGGHIVNHQWAFDWHHDVWPWTVLVQGHYNSSQIFR